MVDNITNLLPIPLLEDMKTHLRSVQEAEELKHAQNKELELIRAKTEAVRTAQAALVENRRNLPYNERGVTAEEITAYADTLLTYISQE